MPMLPLPMAAKSSHQNPDAALLGTIRVAKPCSADWNAMTGDDRSRFCQHCEKNVYNLSAMSATEAAALVREKEGKLCVRYYQRADGTVLTQDCPVGVARWQRRVKRAFAASIVGAASVLLAAGDLLRLSHGQKPLVVERMQVWAERFAPPVPPTPEPTPPPVAVAGGISFQPITAPTPVTMGTPAPPPRPEGATMGEIAVSAEPIQGRLVMGKPRLVVPPAPKANAHRVK